MPTQREFLFDDDESRSDIETNGDSSPASIKPVDRGSDLKNNLDSNELKGSRPEGKDLKPPLKNAPHRRREQGAEPGPPELGGQPARDESAAKCVAGGHDELTDQPPVSICRLAPAFRGLLVIGDPHLEARTPGFRKDDYPRTVLGKLTWCLEYAIDEQLFPVLLGDLFQLPRDNPNWLIVELLEMFKGYADRSGAPLAAIYGNHDVHENRLDEHDSFSILARAESLTLLDEHRAVLLRGPGIRSNPTDPPAAGLAETNADLSPATEPSTAEPPAYFQVLLGGTPWGQALPDLDDISRLKMLAGMDTSTESRCQTGQFIGWITHHDLQLPGYEAGTVPLATNTGIDVVVNGHIHRPLPAHQQRVEEHTGTLWLNPGNITRRKRSDATRAHTPSVLRIDFRDDGTWSYRRETVPHQPFDEVFYEAVIQADEANEASNFVAGLAELKARRTETGAGLSQFLELNLSQFAQPVADEIRDLASEVLDRPWEPAAESELESETEATSADTNEPN